MRVSARLRVVVSAMAACIAGVQTASAALVDLTAPGNPIVGVAATAGSSTSTASTVGTVPGVNNYPSFESPAAAIDNNFSAGNKYLNFQETGVGFIVTLGGTPGPLSAFTLFTANDAPDRDPLTITLEGTNSANPTTTLNSTWSPIYSGVSGLATDPGRNAAGTTVNFVPTTAGSFQSYRFLVTSVRNSVSANSTQFSEIELLTVPEPGTVGLLGLAAVGLLARRRAAR